MRTASEVLGATWKYLECFDGLRVGSNDRPVVIFSIDIRMGGYPLEDCVTLSLANGTAVALCYLALDATREEIASSFVAAAEWVAVARDGDAKCIRSAEFRNRPECAGVNHE